MIGFADKNSLKRTADAASIFSGPLPSTLSEAELRVMEHAKKQQQKQARPRLVANEPALPPPPPDRRRQIALSHSYYKLAESDRDQILRAQFGKLFAYLEQLRRCVQCTQLFYEMTNLASYKCRWHPGRLRTYTRSETGKTHEAWDCCHMPENGDPFDRRTRYGCCYCDHTDSAYERTKSNQMKIPIVLAERLLVPQVRMMYKQTPLHSDSITIKDALNLSCELARTTTFQSEEVAMSRPLPRVFGRGTDDTSLVIQAIGLDT